jgi:hypothetical protein
MRSQASQVPEFSRPARAGLSSTGLACGPPGAITGASCGARQTFRWLRCISAFTEGEMELWEIH